MTNGTIQTVVDEGPMTTLKYLNDLKKAFADYFVQSNVLGVTGMETDLLLGKDILPFAQEVARCMNGVVRTVKSGRTGIPQPPAFVAAIPPEPAPDGHISEVDLPSLAIIEPQPGQTPFGVFGPFPQTKAPSDKEEVDPHETVTVVHEVPAKTTTQEIQTGFFGPIAQATMAAQPTQTDSLESKPGDAPPAAINIEETGPYHDADYVPPPVKPDVNPDE